MTQLTHLSTLATLPGLPQAGAEELARSGHPDIRVIVASRRDLTEKVRSTLALDRNCRVRHWASRQIDDPELMIRFATSSVDRDRMAAAENPVTPPGTLERLANDVTSVAQGILRNPAADRGLVELALARTPQQLLTQGTHYATKIQRAAEIVAAHPWISDLWATSNNTALRRVALRSPGLGQEAARAAAGQGNRAGRTELRRNPFVRVQGSVEWLPTPRTVAGMLQTRQGRRDLAKSGSPTLELLVAQHPDLELDLAQEMVAAEHAGAQQTSDVLGALARSHGYPVLRLVLHRYSQSHGIAIARVVPAAAVLHQASGARQVLGEVTLPHHGTDSPTFWTTTIGLSATWTRTTQELLEVAADACR